MLALLLFMDGKESLGCGMSTVDGGKVVTENLANVDGAVDGKYVAKKIKKNDCKGGCSAL